MRWNPFRKKTRPPARLEESLSELERRAAAASPGYKAQFFARAGDVCAQAGARERALQYWGQAVDLYLGTARPRAAAALCRKIISYAPDVIRARRTLALLAIGEGHTEEALRQVEEYASAARNAGQTELAVKQLRLMGEATWSTRFRSRVAEMLRELGDADGAEYVGRPLPAEQREEGALADHAHDRWSTILRVALMGPDEARRVL